jgi:hypothetical protein
MCFFFATLVITKGRRGLVMPPLAFFVAFVIALGRKGLT